MKLETLYQGTPDKAAAFRHEQPVLQLYLKKLTELLNSRYGGDFKLQEPIDVGGTGVLFRAAHAMIPGELVLKFNRPELPPNAISMVENERRALLLLHHPGIIRVTDSGVANLNVGGFAHRLSFVIEPLLRGSMPLGRHVEEFSPKWAEPNRKSFDDALEALVKLLHQWVAALNYIHHQGFVYLDLKPDNAIVDKNGRLLVVDFGSAKRFSREEIRLPSEVIADLMKALAVSTCTSEVDTLLPRRREEVTNVFFTKRYAHPYLRELRRRSTTNRPAATIERRFLHPRFDYYSLGKSILELLNTIAERNPNVCLPSPLFQPLHLLATRLLDGHNELSRDSEDVTAEIWGDLTQNDYERIGYRDLEAVLDDLENVAKLK